MSQTEKRDLKKKMDAARIRGRLLNFGKQGIEPVFSEAEWQVLASDPQNLDSFFPAGETNPSLGELKVRIMEELAKRSESLREEIPPAEVRSSESPSELIELDTKNADRRIVDAVAEAKHGGLETNEVTAIQEAGDSYKTKVAEAGEEYKEALAYLEHAANILDPDRPAAAKDIRDRMARIAELRGSGKMESADKKFRKLLKEVQEVYQIPRSPVRSDETAENVPPASEEKAAMVKNAERPARKERKLSLADLKEKAFDLAEEALRQKLAGEVRGRLRGVRVEVDKRLFREMDEENLEKLLTAIERTCLLIVSKDPEIFKKYFISIRTKGPQVSPAKGFNRSIELNVLSGSPKEVANAVSDYVQTRERTEKRSYDEVVERAAEHMPAEHLAYKILEGAFGAEEGDAKDANPRLAEILPKADAADVSVGQALHTDVRDVDPEAARSPEEANLSPEEQECIALFARLKAAPLKTASPAYWGREGGYGQRLNAWEKKADLPADMRLRQLKEIEGSIAVDERDLAEADASVAKLKELLENMPPIDQLSREAVVSLSGLHAELEGWVKARARLEPAALAERMKNRLAEAEKISSAPAEAPSENEPKDPFEAESKKLFAAYPNLDRVSLQLWSSHKKKFEFLGKLKEVLALLVVAIGEDRLREVRVIRPVSAGLSYYGDFTKEITIGLDQKPEETAQRIARAMGINAVEKSEPVLEGEIVDEEEEDGPEPEIIDAEGEEDAEGASDKEREANEELAEVRSAYVDAYHAAKEELRNIEKPKDKRLARELQPERIMSKVEAFVTQHPDWKDRDLLVADMASRLNLDARRVIVFAEAAEARMEYMNARKALGQNLFNLKRVSLSMDPSMPKEKLRAALSEYRSGELFNRIVLQEMELLQKEEIEKWPPGKAGVWRRMWDASLHGAAWAAEWYKNQGLMRRVAISTIFATGAVALGGGFAVAGVGGAALFAGSRFVRGLGAAVITPQIGKLIGKLGDRMFVKGADEKLERLQKNFSIDNLENIEMSYAKALKEKMRRKGMSAGFTVAGTFAAGFLVGGGLRALEAHAVSGMDALPAAPHGGPKELPKDFLDPKHDARAYAAEHPQGGNPAVSEGRVAAEVNKPAAPSAEKVIPPPAVEKPETFIETNKGGNDSAWKMAERQMQSHYGDKFNRMNSAQRTYVLDSIKDRLGNDATDKMAEGSKLDFNKIVGDKDAMEKIFERADKLTAAQVKSIELHNKALDEWVKTHRGEVLTQAKADEVIERIYHPVPPEGLPVGEPPTELFAGAADSAPDGVPPAEFYGEAAPALPGEGSSLPAEATPPQEFFGNAPEGAAGQAPAEYFGQDGAVSPEAHFGEAHYLPKAMLLMEKSGEFDPIRGVSIEEYMKHVPSTHDLDSDALMAEKFRAGKLTVNMRLGDGTERSVLVTERHVQTKDFMDGMRQKLMPNRIRFASMDKFRNIVDRVRLPASA